MNRRLATFLLAAAASTAAPLALPQAYDPAKNLPSLGDTEREELSPAVERKLGEQIMLEVRRDKDYLDDAPLTEYLNSFGNHLLATHPEARGEANFDFGFFAVRDPMMNAFALPGGFIGIHSGMLLAAQNESELASVLAHEIGHVAQRHIARMLGKQRKDALIPLASVLLAALASRSSSDASTALLLGGQGLAAQRQLNFSRDAEREADRIGFQIMHDGGYDPSGMVALFGRMQNATRAYSDAVPAFLLSHPLTTERIADIQARIREERYKQHADSLDFHLIRARVRVLQDDTPQGWRDAAAAFDGQLRQGVKLQTAAAKYGLALVALRRRDAAKAQSLLDQARDAAHGLTQSARSGEADPADSPVLSSLAIDIKVAANRPAEALREADAAMQKFPLSRGIARQYADALIAAGRYDDAVHYLRDQIQLYRQEPQLQDRLARTYAAQGKQALQHLALAETYALSGSLPAALEQLSIARKAPDASFYDLSMIDAREREFQARRREEMKEGKEGMK